jgi:hypothetical protein
VQFAGWCAHPNLKSGLCTLTGLLWLTGGVRAAMIPRHPDARPINWPNVGLGTGACSDGKWMFNNGKMIVIGYTEEAAIAQDEMLQLVESAGWRRSTLRGIPVHVPANARRSTWRYWLNIDIVPDVAFAAGSGQRNTRIYNRYRIFVCPPVALMASR